MEEKSLEAKVAQHSTEIKNINKRLDKLEPIVETTNKIALSVERMATIQEGMLEEQKAQREDINELKQQPAKDAHTIKMDLWKCIISAVLGALIAAVLTLILK